MLKIEKLWYKIGPEGFQKCGCGFILEGIEVSGVFTTLIVRFLPHLTRVMTVKNLNIIG